MTYKHYILTMFNLKLWAKDKKDQQTLTDEWMKERFLLFEEYCLPSFVQQSSKDFVWLCLFDSETPQEYRDKMEEYKKDAPQITCLFLTEEETKDWASNVKTYILKDAKGQEYIITSRIDNDDAIHRDYVKMIHEEFEKSEQIGLYTYIDGYQYFPHKNLMIDMRYPHNHFITLIEPYREELEMVFHINHAAARKHYKDSLTDIKNHNYWMEIVHAHNVSNDLRITSRIRNRLCWNFQNQSDFGIPFTRTRGQMVYANIITYPCYFVTSGLRKLYRKWTKKA